MRILALECSTDVGSLALLAGGQVVWERSWAGLQGHRQAWVAGLNEWVRRGEIPLGEVDLFAVGVGPGAFSGLRMAISLMQGLALPVQAPLHAVSSGAALAARVAREGGGGTGGGHG